MSQYQELSLFPLHNVYFPGLPISLHIFEERYIIMIKKCIAANSPFGVVLIKSGEEAHGPTAEPCTVGCLATIKKVNQLKDGKMNITALSGDRFRIISISTQEPYLVGSIQTITMEKEDSPLLSNKGFALRVLLEKYLVTRAEKSEIDTIIKNLPEDPIPLGYMAATLLETSLMKKQELLCITKPLQFLQTLLKMYNDQMRIDKLLQTGGKTDYMGPFSTN